MEERETHLLCYQMLRSHTEKLRMRSGRLEPQQRRGAPVDFPGSRLPQAKPGATLELGLESECQTEGEPSQSNRLELWSARFGAGPRVEGRFTGN